MRNYIRYIVILILIIAFGLLLISVINKFTEKDVTKVNNKNVQTVEKDDEKDENENVTLDVNGNEEKENITIDNNQEEQATTTTSTTTTDNISNVDVPNTKSDSNILFTVLGFTIILGGLSYIRKHQSN